MQRQYPKDRIYLREVRPVRLTTNSVFGMKTGFKLLGVAGVAAVLCVPVFASAQSHYYHYDYDNYRHYDDGVVCFPAEQTVVEGQVAYFTAYGGDGEYDWEAENRNYRDRGRTFSHRFDDEGIERVEVTSDGESDTCRVRVVERDYYYPAYPAAPIYTQPFVQPVTLTTTYVPGMPNTGFPPLSSASFAFAVVMLFGVGLAVYPYAKKAFATARG